MEYTYLLVFASVLVLSQACTVNLGKWVERHPEGKETDEMKVYYSEVVVFGQVIGISDSNKAGVKNADIDVICSYKGNIQTKRIHVYGLGNKMGEIAGCPKAELKQDEKAILFLKKLPDRNGAPWFEVEFSPMHGLASVIVDDLTMVCGLNQTFGGEVTEDGACFEILGPEDCEKYILPTAPPSTVAPPTTTAKPDKGVTEVIVGPAVDEEGSEENTDDKQNDGTNTYDTKTEKPSNTAESKDDPENSAVHVSVSCLLVLLSSIALYVA